MVGENLKNKVLSNLVLNKESKSGRKVNFNTSEK